MSAHIAQLATVEPPLQWIAGMVKLNSEMEKVRESVKGQLEPLTTAVSALQGQMAAMQVQQSDVRSVVAAIQVQYSEVKEAMRLWDEAQRAVIDELQQARLSQFWFRQVSNILMYLGQMLQDPRLNSLIAGMMSPQNVVDDRSVPAAPSPRARLFGPPRPPATSPNVRPAFFE
jgi:hypothetical protein